MAIYPVRLVKWFPARGKDSSLAKTCKDLIEYCGIKCPVCGKKPHYNGAIADHSMPWGYWGEVWCTKKCYDKYLEINSFKEGQKE